jgi:hypothetical protein
MHELDVLEHFFILCLLESRDRDIILHMIRVSSYSLLKLLRKPINSSGHYMEKNNPKTGIDSSATAT